MMQHTQYQCSKPSGFRHEGLLCFPYLSLFYARMWQILAQGHNLNKYGKGPLDDAKNQIYNTLGLVVLDKEEYYMSFYTPM